MQILKGAFCSRLSRGALLPAGRRWAPRVLALLAGACGSAHALDPSRHVSQYAHTSWRLADGSFNGVPSVVTQTDDGYLWIGTSAGLVRFDGARFVPFVPLPGESIADQSLRSLLAARDGSLWLGMGSGLQRLKGGHLTTYDVHGAVDNFEEDGSGAVWLTREKRAAANGPLCRIDDKGVKCFGKDSGIRSPYLGAMAMQPDGSFWVAGVTELDHWQSGTTTRYELPARGIAEDQDGIRAVTLARDGSLWVGSVLSGGGLGLERLVNGEWMPFTIPGLVGSSLHVTALMRDRNDSLWVGTAGDGLYRIQNGTADHFATADGLSGNTVNSFFEDKQGNLWVTTSSGLERFRDLPVTSYSSREGLGEDAVNAVLASKDGSIWISNLRELDHLQHGKISAVRLPDDMPGHSFTALMEDKTGHIWAGLDDGLIVFDGNRVRHVASLDGHPIGTIVSLTQDQAGDVWLVSLGAPGTRILRVRDGRVQEELTSQIPESTIVVADPRRGIWAGTIAGDLVHYTAGRVEIGAFHRPPNVGGVRDVIVTPDGTVLGATSAGLIGWRNGKTRTMSKADGLPCEFLKSLALDRDGGLWLYSECGLVAITRDQLEAWWRPAQAAPHFRLFDAVDGSQPAFAGFSPRASLSPDGQLWFANGSLLQTVAPEQLRASAILPRVHVEDLIADGKHRSLGSTVRLEPRTHDIEIDYTAPSFAVPQRVRFRYKLEGHDTQWQGPVTRRQAFFTDLAPGDYRFRVRASNEDDVWGNEEATVAFSIPPSFVQSRWFLGLCTAATLLLLWLLVRFRLERIAAQIRMRFEERIGERERIARELHDTLLQSTQALVLIFQAFARRLAPDNAERGLLEKAIAQADDVLREGRNRVQDLRLPADALGDLPEAFVELGKQLELTSPCRLSVAIQGRAREVVPEVRDEVFRIGREALVNAFQHAGASAILLEIDYRESSLKLRVSDDGVGLLPEVIEAGGIAGHWGMRGMRERARRIGAQLSISGQPAGGTLVELSVVEHLAFESQRGVSRWCSIRLAALRLLGLRMPAA